MTHTTPQKLTTQADKSSGLGVLFVIRGMDLRVRVDIVCTINPPTATEIIRTKLELA